MIYNSPERITQDKLKLSKLFQAPCTNAIFPMITLVFSCRPSLNNNCYFSRLFDSNVFSRKLIIGSLLIFLVKFTFHSAPLVLYVFTALTYSLVLINVSVKFTLSFRPAVTLS